jgi:hypothetical protein
MVAGYPSQIVMLPTPKIVGMVLNTSAQGTPICEIVPATAVLYRDR